ncbi:MAG TPA: hypothetical protein PKD55_20185, partial [Bellilinea sp.]|nr:hypothetical protein [Bellilinea sp.]
RRTVAGPGLVKQITAGKNGTRVYYWKGKYYCVDGEFDCRRPGEELPAQAWGSFRSLEAAEQAALG